MRRLYNKKGQNTLEYALLIMVIVGALVAMQIYAKRGFEGRLSKAADDIGEQFEPGATEWEWTTERNSQTVETNNQGVVNTYMRGEGDAAQGKTEVTTRYGYEKVEGWQANKPGGRDVRPR